MSDQQESNSTAPNTSAFDLSWLDVLIILAKHKLFLVKAVVAVGVLAAAVSLVLPNVYTGTTRILPPQQNQSTAAMLLGQLGGLAGATGSSLGLKNPSDLYVGMLRSRTVADGLIKRFSLQELYGQESMIETRRKLASLTTISTGKDGLITVEFDDQDPKRAADIANAYVEELDRLSQGLAVTEASQRRLFFERQLRQAKDGLTAAELAMKQTQEKTGLIKLDDQGKAIIEAVASLRAQIAAKEVELRAMRTFATEQNSDYIRAQNQMAGLRSELTKLERSKIAGAGDVLLPTGKVPEAGLEYVRKFRDVKYYETIFELIARQFEVAKIDEAREAAVIQVVDLAVVPDRKSSPRRSVIVLVSVATAAFIAFLWVFAGEVLERMRRDPIHAARLTALRTYIALRPQKR